MFIFRNGDCESELVWSSTVCIYALTLDGRLSLLPPFDALQETGCYASKVLRMRSMCQEEEHPSLSGGIATCQSALSHLVKLAAEGVCCTLVCRLH